MKPSWHPYQFGQNRRFGKSDSKALSEIRFRIGLTKTQIYHFLGWYDPPIACGGSDEKSVAEHSKFYVSHPWGEFLKNLNSK